MCVPIIFRIFTFLFLKKIESNVLLTLKKLIANSFKGIVQPFELGGVTINK